MKIYKYSGQRDCSKLLVHVSWLVLSAKCIVNLAKIHNMLILS